MQSLLINERRKLTNDEFNVNNVQNLVQDLIWNLFIKTFNAQVSLFRLTNFLQLSRFSRIPMDDFIQIHLRNYPNQFNMNRK